MNKLKIVNASRGFIHQYENVKRKLLSCNADIYFNQQCLLKRLIPKFARIKIAGNSPAKRSTKLKTQTIRIKEEIKFLYMKKPQLNRKLYYLHLHLANTWGNTWHYIQDTSEAKLNRLINKKYERLNTKLLRLSQEQTKIPTKHHDFYPRVVNNTNITFTDNENKLLNKGLKYNFHHKKKNWLTNLALEAETAINYLPFTDREY
jgi:hypothetical protein